MHRIDIVKYCNEFVQEHIRAIEAEANNNNVLNVSDEETALMALLTVLAEKKGYQLE